MFMTRRSVLALLAFGLAFTLPGKSLGYKLQQRGKRVHEAMTDLSAACFTESLRDKKPVGSCAGYLDVAGEAARVRRALQKQRAHQEIPGLRLAGEPLTYEALRLAVQWPDDPQRKLNGFRSLVNFGAGFASYCRRLMKKQSDVAEAGLLCASHFGEMQFLHAMAAQPTESTQDTRTKALEWAKFAYDYIVDERKDGENLCGALAGYPNIRRALIGDGTEWLCKGEPGEGGPRTVGQLFGFNCTRLFGSKKCYIVRTVAERRRAALGAILHVIQDSYAQGHVQRGSCGPSPNQPQAVIRVAPVERFLAYADQKKRAHSASDQWPSTETIDLGMDHPVVAGARVLEMIAAGKRSDVVPRLAGPAARRIAPAVRQRGRMLQEATVTVPAGLRALLLASKRTGRSSGRTSGRGADLVPRQAKDARHGRTPLTSQRPATRAQRLHRSRSRLISDATAPWQTGRLPIGWCWQWPAWSGCGT